ncbi:MAG: carboxylating nicotinate-nucleotide diphosphorylase [Marinilabiliaceae bacterium]|nr:carboxylating nicotinate-nucleotide diphosphorylase [Marinilabiliaceae bacterium]
MNNDLIEQLIDIAIKEDIGNGDHSSLACIPASEKGKAQLLVKEEGIIAGINIAERIFKKIDPDVIFERKINDGDKIKPGNIAFTVEGKTLALLQAERLILNFMQRMSGIATTTNKYASLIADLKTRVLDTRKTTPGLRLIEKEAVKIGGGTNHRIGLYDMIMLKDNHIDFAGGIEKAVNACLEYMKFKGLDLKIEVEVRNFKELDEVLKVGKIHRIMLDNFTTDDTKKAVALINGKYEIESSGNITLDTIRDYAECGVDFVSVGALTHQIKSLDLSLKAI